MAIEHRGPLWPYLPDSEEVQNALVLGVRDYVRKDGFRTVILGLSGGIDSRADRDDRGRRARPGPGSTRC